MEWREDGGGEVRRMDEDGISGRWKKDEVMCREKGELKGWGWEGWKGVRVGQKRG